MKYLILLFICLQLNLATTQSVILLEQDSVFQYNENEDISNDFIDFALDLYFKNNTEDSININWRRELDEDCPIEWDIATADQFLTYVPEVNESQIPLEMAPIDSHFIVRQIFFPRTVPGCCDIKMIFYRDEEPNMPIDTGYYHIEINSPDCQIVSNIKGAILEWSIFPNPTIDIVEVERLSSLSSIQILDVNGKVQPVNIQKNDTFIDLSFLPAGIYYFTAQNESLGVIRKKFIKL